MDLDFGNMKLASALVGLLIAFFLLTSNAALPEIGVTMDAPARAVSSIKLTLVADRGEASDTVVSLGMPFPPGLLGDIRMISLRNQAGAEIPAYVAALAHWPVDGSLRSALVAFRITLPHGASTDYEVALGTPRSLSAPEPIPANPDGPVAALLPAAWYSSSQHSGTLVPVEENKRFAAYDATLESTLWRIDYSAYGVSCERTADHRTYYDGPHALYQLFLRTGDARHFRRAREEAVWYRAHELRWSDHRAIAIQSCEANDWTPAKPLNWSVLRRMLSQGMLDDHLLTGDPAAREAVLGLGEAYRRNLPSLIAGSTPSLEATERNMAWTVMGLVAYAALDDRAVVKEAMTTAVDRAVAWQALGCSGAFEHDLARADPEECSDGPRGGSPFMTSLLVDALGDYHQLTRDTRIVEVVSKVAQWYATLAITSDKKAFRYLWNCLNSPYDDSRAADLNLLIVHVFGAAFDLTGDFRWLRLGDSIADHGVAAMFSARPKQWNQAARSFGKYLGYRAKALPP